MLSASYPGLEPR